MDSGILILFVILVILSAFFSSSEIGIISVPRHLIESLVKQGNKNAKKLIWLKDRTDKLLITILIGNNLVNTLIAALATSMSINLGRASGLEEGIAVGIATAVITIILLLFGEILPKTMATRIALPFGLFIAPIYIWLVRLFNPIVWVIEKFIRMFDKNSSSHIRQVTHEEIEALVDIAKEQGSIEEDMARHIKKVIDFHDTTVQEIMTPRIRVETIKSSATVNETIAMMDSFSHTRIPVFNKNIDDIQWLVSYKEMVSYRGKNMGDRILKDIPLKKAYKIPLTMPLDKLIEIFRKEHQQFAIVMDEYGGVSGIVTLEDIIEEVFGDFLDETDKEITPIKNDGDSYIVQSSVMIDDLLDTLNLSWHDVGLQETEYSGETVGYVITSELERFPEKNEKLVFALDPEEKSESDHYQRKELHIEIAKRDDNTIHEIIATVVVS